MFKVISFFLFGVLALSSAQLDVDLGGLIKPGMKFNITDDVNGILPQMNEFVESKGMSTVNLPDIKLKGKKQQADFTDAIFEGLNKMSKATRGTITLTRQITSRVCTQIIFDNTKLSIDKSGTPLSWNIGSLTMDLSFTLEPEKGSASDCNTKYNRVRINKVENVVGSDSSADEETLNTIINYYNNWLKNPKVLRKIGSIFDICEPSSQTINNVVKNQGIQQ